MIGLISSFNVYRLSKEIDGLITNNYKSIDASNKMIEIIETQDKAILQYIVFQNKSSIDTIYNSNDELYKWLNVERNNITEVGEANVTNKIGDDYLLFIKSFSKIQEYQEVHSNNENIRFYNSRVSPLAVKTKDDLVALSNINEKAMFNGRNKDRKSVV